jgi:hypothetical protein
MLELENINTITSTIIIRLFQFVNKVSGEISKKYSKTFEKVKMFWLNPSPHHTLVGDINLERIGVGDIPFLNTIMV